MSRDSSVENSGRPEGEGRGTALPKALLRWCYTCADTLSAMSEQQVKVQAGAWELWSHEPLAERFPEGLVSLAVMLDGGLEGQFLLALPSADAWNLSALLVGYEPEEDELSGLHADIVGEALRQMASALSSELSRVCGLPMQAFPASPQQGRLPDLGAGMYQVLEQELYLPGDIEASSLLVLPKSMADKIATFEGEAGPSLSDIEEQGAREGKSIRNKGIFPNLEGDSNGLGKGQGNLEVIWDVPLEVMVVLGRTSLTIQELISLGEGSVLELDKLAGEPVELYVRERLVAVGEVVVIDERFGVRVLEVVAGSKEASKKYLRGRGGAFSRIMA